ncbi:primosomal protein DnaI [Lactobacillus sp. ESL0236]|uniref:primosomal protein DnaI n=1 Tax=unclassified Lactobacillus TaxID=2620435 RepID=UPI000EFDAA0D|nr:MULTISPECIES: primosomal protein DnaI [unclassified Lactobacillus]RMC39147.1 primosomal protein DnaI [Lactobacillus sp. ESL0237]RMC43430.1 primosomal protein DnaI [Lactobacillus sp. ESL0234]RMC44342.1 primosomal protein DnaI [Lactobacillus sp. ESL0236]
MRTINQLIIKNNSKLTKKNNFDEIRKQILADPKIKKFINVYRDKITDEMINASLSSLYEFYISQHHKDPVIVGYRPELMLSSNAITLKYVPEESKLAQDRDHSIKKHVRLINLPLNLHNVRLSQVEVTAGRRTAIAKIQEFLSLYKTNVHQKGLYLSGDFGVGKTYLLAGLANSIAAMNKQVIFLHLPTFIANLASHFGDNSLTNEVQRIAHCDLLILDDVGAETLSQWSRDEVLGIILQARMDNELPTFFSSNFAMADLEEHFKETKNAIDPVKAARLMERVKTLATEIIVSGPNRRS